MHQLGFVAEITAGHSGAGAGGRATPASQATLRNCIIGYSDGSLWLVTIRWLGGTTLAHLPLKAIDREVYPSPPIYSKNVAY